MNLENIKKYIKDKLFKKKEEVKEEVKEEIQKEVKEEIQEEILIKEKDKRLVEEELEELLLDAYILSRKFNYNELMYAAKKETAEIQGREVHGYMQRVFPNKYRWLIANSVFDYAVDFVKKYYKQEIFSVVKDYDFPNAIINIIHLPREESFDLYPNFIFDKFIVLTQGEKFENAVHWIENYEWVDDAGYRTIKTLAPCNFLNLGFTLWSLPVLILKDAVGMDKLFFEAKTKAENIKDVNDQILKKHIYTKRQEEKTTNEKSLEMEIRYNQLEERHQYLIDDIRAGDTRNPEEKLKDFAKRYDKHEKRNNIDWKRLIVGFIIIVVIILIIIGTVALLYPPTPPEIPPEDIPPDVLGSLFSVFKKK